MAIIAIRVRPGASRVRVGGCHQGPYGPALVVAVHSPPVDGRATEAALRALSSALGIRTSAVTLKAGAASRDKLVTIPDAPVELAARVASLRDGVL